MIWEECSSASAPRVTLERAKQASTHIGMEEGGLTGLRGWVGLAGRGKSSSSLHIVLTQNNRIRCIIKATLSLNGPESLSGFSQFIPSIYHKKF